MLRIQRDGGKWSPQSEPWFIPVLMWERNTPHLLDLPGQGATRKIVRFKNRNHNSSELDKTFFQLKPGLPLL